MITRFQAQSNLSEPVAQNETNFLPNQRYSCNDIEKINLGTYLIEMNPNTCHAPELQSNFINMGPP